MKWLLWLCAFIRVLSVYRGVDWEADVCHRQERVWSETNWHQLFPGLSQPLVAQYRDT